MIPLFPKKLVNPFTKTVCSQSNHNKCYIFLMGTTALLKQRFSHCKVIINGVFLIHFDCTLLLLLSNEHGTEKVQCTLSNSLSHKRQKSSPLTLQKCANIFGNISQVSFFLPSIFSNRFLCQKKVEGSKKICYF